MSLHELHNFIVSRLWIISCKSCATPCSANDHLKGSENVLFHFLISRLRVSLVNIACFEATKDREYLIGFQGAVNPERQAAFPAEDQRPSQGTGCLTSSML